MDSEVNGVNAGIVVLIVLLFAVGVALAVWQWRSRVELLRQRAALAVASGWTFVPDAPEMVDAWPCDPFGTGKGRRAENCVSGTSRGVPFSCFEYHYYTESHSTDAQGNRTTSRHNHRFDVAVLHLRANVPDLALQPQGAFSRLLDAFGGKDIDLEWETFNRAYRLICADRKFAFDTFGARTMEYLVAQGAVRFCLTGGDALVYREGRGTDPAIWGPGDPGTPVDRSPAPLDVVLTVLRGIPPFVWQDRGGVPPSLTAAQW
ncbi:MAG: hypothetical protein M3Y71_04245 [Actinomycetota bacterium]|nr:hypothetical protein [Actinomycetota bacterium]